MKNYYRILQIHPEAEEEIISAAYRGLMRKYHPDMLSEDSKNDPELLEKVKDINEAYRVLSNPVTREKYRRESTEETSVHYTKERRYQSRTTSYSPKSPFDKQKDVNQVKYERKTFYIRCSTSNQTYKGLLSRIEGIPSPYVLLGFEPATEFDDYRENSTGDTPKQFIDIDKFSQEQINEILNPAENFTLGSINWAGIDCPSCHSMIENRNGTKATWTVCSACHRISCVGKVKRNKSGKHKICPWCGSKRYLTRSIKVGGADHLKVRSEISKEKLEQKQLAQSSEKGKFRKAISKFLNKRKTSSN